MGFFGWLSASRNFNIVRRRKSLWLIRPMVEGPNFSPISFTSHEGTSRFIILHQHAHLSNQEPHSSWTYARVSIVNMPRDTKECWPIECGLCLRFSDHSKNCTQVILVYESVTCLSWWNISLEYAWSIKDSCYECRPGYEDRLQRQSQEPRPGFTILLVWMNCQHHEFEVHYSVLLFTLFTHIITYWAQHTRWLLIIETQWTVPSTTLSLRLGQHTHNLFKSFCGPWLSQNMQFQEKHCSGVL